MRRIVDRFAKAHCTVFSQGVGIDNQCVQAPLEKVVRYGLATNCGQMKRLIRLTALVERELEPLFDEVAQGRAPLLGGFARPDEKLVGDFDSRFHMGTHTK